jgi:hypothetical protein
MVLPGYVFRRVLELPRIDWSRVSDHQQRRVIDRCQELLSQLSDIHEIEGIKRTEAAKYLFERALIDTLELLGHGASEETRTELVLDAFLRERVK